MPTDFAFDGRRIRIRFADEITASDLIDVIRRIVDTESAAPMAPDRIIDLGPSTRLAIGFGDIDNLVRIRQAWALRNPIRTAIVTHSAAQQGYARMFQTLNDHPLVTVRLFDSVRDADAWLDSPAAGPPLNS